jgi:hypothetical protein
MCTYYAKFAPVLKEKRRLRTDGLKTDYLCRLLYLKGDDNDHDRFISF